MSTMPTPQADNTPPEADAATLAAAEKRANRYVEMRDVAVVYLVAIIIAAFTLFLPWNGAVRGYDILMYTPAAQAAATATPERMFAWGLVLFVIVGGGALLALRFAKLAYVVWAFTCITAVYGMFAIWIRQSRGVGAGEAPGFGLWIAFASLLICAVIMTRVVFRPSQSAAKELAEERRRAQRETPLARTQRELMERDINATRPQSGYDIQRPPRRRRTKRTTTTQDSSNS